MLTALEDMSGLALPTGRLGQDQQIVSDKPTIGIKGLKRPLGFHRRRAALGDSLWHTLDALQDAGGDSV